MSSCTECQMEHWVAVHKFECQGPETGSPGSLDTDSGTFSEVHSSGISRSENHKIFVDFTDTSNVNEVGPPAQVLLNPKGPTRMQQKLPSWTVTSNGQQRAKAKKREKPPRSMLNAGSLCGPCGIRFSIDLMQMICMEKVVLEKSLDDSIQETTLIHHYFGGCLQSQVKCIQCLHESNPYEPMMDLLVDIQGNVKSVEDALAQFTDTELSDGATSTSVTSMCCSCALEILVVTFMSISKARKLNSFMLLETSC
ncbi:unnamed protein product [Sphagnum compactum]